VRSPCACARGAGAATGLAILRGAEGILPSEIAAAGALLVLRRPTTKGLVLRAFRRRVTLGRRQHFDIFQYESLQLLQASRGLVDGERTLSCLALAVQYQGTEIITIEGLAENGTLHPMQAAFVEHDGFQCGYCTPGQICSAVGMVREFRDGSASAVTRDVSASSTELSDEEIKERMSGNLCRCGAYVGIREAIREAAEVAG